MTEETETGAAEETPAEEVAETPPAEGALSSDKAKEEKVEEPPKRTEPPPEHPRFGKVYGKMKKYERTLAEKEKDIEALREHTFKLDEAMRKLKEDKEDIDIPEPDPVVDPDAHKKWREFREHKQEQKYQESARKAELSSFIQIESGIHEDYDDVIKIADREMKRNPELAKQVWGSANPARAAYKLGKKTMAEQTKEEKADEEAVKAEETKAAEAKAAKAKAEEDDRKKRLDASSVETGGLPPAKTSAPVVTEDEKRVIRNLFRDMPYKEAEKKYLANRQALGR